MRYDDIHPDHIDPNTSRPYAGYSSPSIEAFADSAAMSNSQRAWEQWISAAEIALGIDNLDGDERVEGYSLDSGYDAFEAGISASAYSKGERA